MKPKEKLMLINKCFKKTNLLLDIEIYDYEGCFLYIRLDYYKKEKVHKISWIDLNLINDKNIKPYLNSEYVSVKYLENIAHCINNNNLDGIDYSDLDVNDGIVKLNLYFYEKNKKDSISILFHRYIPNELPFLFDIFVNIFDNLPYKLEILLRELSAKLNGEVEKYDHEKSFKLDLFNDDISSAFRKNIIVKGNDYYDKNKVIFLEKINDKYYAFIRGNNDYVIIINYNEAHKETSLHCSCPCEFHCKHEYAVLRAIRNKKFNKFYKVAYDITSENVMEKIAGFKYYLCAGIKENNIILLNNYGGIEYAPLFDKDGKLMWKIIEDDKNNTLKKKIEKLT